MLTDIEQTLCSLYAYRYTTHSMLVICLQTHNRLYVCVVLTDIQHTLCSFSAYKYTTDSMFVLCLQIHNKLCQVLEEPVSYLTDTQQTLTSAGRTSFLSHRYTTNSDKCWQSQFLISQDLNESWEANAPSETISNSLMQNDLNWKTAISNLQTLCLSFSTAG